MLLFYTFLFLFANGTAQVNVYLIPGQGADYRLYDSLQLPEGFRKIHVKCPTPAKNSTLPAYAKQLSSQIDTSTSFVLLGVSLGGMLATELTDLLNPEYTIIISSAKCQYELPKRYKAFRKFPLNKYLHPNLYRMGSKIAQPLVEPDRKNAKATFKKMLHDKDPLFLKRTSNMIINWQRSSYSEDIIHVHGTNDHTIPYKNVKANYSIKNGSHMMVLTRFKEVNTIINNELLQLQTSKKHSH